MDPFSMMLIILSRVVLCVVMIIAGILLMFAFLPVFMVDCLS